jgi:hypothetical protein
VTTEQNSANSVETEEPTALAVEANANQSADVGTEPNPRLTPELKELLGRPPLLINEDETLYWKTLDQMATLVRPRNFVEWIYVKGFVDRHWETGWHRSAKTGLLNLGRKYAVAEIARKVIDNKRKDYLDQVHRLSTNWFVDPKVKQEFRELLKLVGLTEDCIPAQALVTHADKYRILDNLDANATARRDAALRELERRRMEARRVQNTKDKVVDDGRSDKLAKAEPRVTPEAGADNGGEQP